VFSGRQPGGGAGSLRACDGEVASENAAVPGESTEDATGADTLAN
jgi:hypothetical protein